MRSGKAPESRRTSWAPSRPHSGTGACGPRIPESAMVEPVGPGRVIDGHHDALPSSVRTRRCPYRLVGRLYRLIGIGQGDADAGSFWQDELERVVGSGRPWGAFVHDLETWRGPPVRGAVGPRDPSARGTELESPGYRCRAGTVVDTDAISSSSRWRERSNVLARKRLPSPTRGLTKYRPVSTLQQWSLAHLNRSGPDRART